MMSNNQEFISDETIDVAEQMDSFRKVRLGFVIDNIHYHTVRYDTIKLGFWVVKLEGM